MYASGILITESFEIDFFFFFGGGWGLGELKT